MKMTMTTWCCITLAALLAGCKAEPGLTQTFGTYQDFIDAPADRVAPAALKAAQEMDLRVAESTDTRVIAYFRDQTKLTVVLEPWSGGQTRVNVRVDPGGNESLAVMTISRIKANVAAAPPPPSPTP